MMKLVVEVPLMKKRDCDGDQEQSPRYHQYNSITRNIRLERKAIIDMRKMNYVLHIDE